MTRTINQITARVIDANFNRVREALRVMEEFARFGLDDAALTKAIKETRYARRREGMGYGTAAAWILHSWERRPSVPSCETTPTVRPPTMNGQSATAWYNQVMARKFKVAMLLLATLATMVVWIRGYWPGAKIQKLEARVAQCALAHPSIEAYSGHESLEKLKQKSHDDYVCEELRTNLGWARRVGFTYASHRFRISDYTVEVTIPRYVWRGHSLRRFWDSGNVRIVVTVPYLDETVNTISKDVYGFAGAGFAHTDHAGIQSGKRGQRYTVGISFYLLVCLFLIYPVAVWFRGPVRRRWRRKRGLCPQCGYNLTGSTVPRCPECGTSTHRKVTT